jgi:hypothetical protein
MNLEVGKVYRLRSRNLLVGVFTGDRFIGIREKFGDRYLDAEYPYDNGGTATAKEELGSIENIPLKISLGSQCQNCGKPAKWSGPPAPAPWVCEGGCEKVYPQMVSNKELFRALEKYEQENVHQS